MGLGHKGPEVEEAQKLMEQHGAEFTKLDKDGNVEKDYGADGFFGEVTQRELKELQKKWGLEETGQLDAKTLERLRQDPAAAEAVEEAEAAKPPEEAAPAETAEEPAGPRIPTQLQIPPSQQGDYDALIGRRDAVKERLASPNLRGRNRRGAELNLRSIEKQLEAFSPEGLRGQYSDLLQQRDSVQTQVDALNGSAGGHRGRNLRQRLQRLNEQLQQFHIPEPKQPPVTEPIMV